MTLDPDKVQLVATSAKQQACEFFGIPAEIEITLSALRMLDGNVGQNLYKDKYLRCTITFDPGQLDSLQEVYETVAHEVAHLESREIMALLWRMEEEQNPLWHELNVGLEKLTTRRTRDFLKVHPYQEEHP